MSSVSSRAPTSTHKPIETDRTCGIDSVTSRTPGTGSERVKGKLLGRIPVGRTTGAVIDGREVELPVRTNLGQPHAEVVAFRQHVGDLVDPLAAAELRDVDETVLARHDVYERAELGDLHDLAVELLADLERHRVHEVVDHLHGLV